MATMTDGLVQEQRQGLRIEMVKVIKAKRERVYAAWTQPEKIKGWFGGDRMSTSLVEVDLKIGGSYRIEMEGAMAVWGEYREIVPNERVSFTWSATWSPGEASLVTVTLKDVEGEARVTEMTMLHERFSTVESLKAHEQGWGMGLAKLEAYLTQ